MRKNQLLKRSAAVAGLALALGAGATFITQGSTQGIPAPKQEPKVITPGTASSAPSDAIVLFDGKNLSEWTGKGGGEAKWKVENGYLEAVRGTGDITTKQKFGDMQLHIEWATPKEVKGEGQGRGNSGIFLQDRYELQVLDSYNNKTYFHGQAGSIYKQSAPLVNASRQPGEWQTYDVIYHAPKFDEAGNVVKKARVTVLHNGVLVQDNFEILGSTTHEEVQPKYVAHPAQMPIHLQDHGNPVRYRNIWVRPL